MQKTILIVEDEFLIAMDLQLLLEDCGWRVIGPVATVQGALRLLEGELPLVALLDVSLRSEEHTSELQSLMRISYAVFCLKKQKVNIKSQTIFIILNL